VEAIKSPVMIVFADADAFSLEHIMEFYGLLGGGKRDAGLDGSGRPINRLAIIPGSTHYNIVSSTAVAKVVVPFLEETMPKKRNN
jgi:hypothetical protein